MVLLVIIVWLFVKMYLFSIFYICVLWFCDFKEVVEVGSFLEDKF